MAKKKAGLGRGLAELLGEGRAAIPDSAAEDRAKALDDAGTASPGSGSPVEDLEPVADDGPGLPGTSPGRGGILELAVSAIRPNPRQPRRSMDAEGLEELARSIDATGMVQPIIVRPMIDGYELIAGERRWRAAQMAGYTVVPAILREVSDTDSLEISLVENVVRQQLNPVDEALALHMLMEDLGATQEGLSARVGKSRSAIANKLRLLELPKEVQELLAVGSLTEGHGRALLGLKSRGQQLKLARRAVREGLSVRAVEAAVRKASEPRADTRARPVPGDAALLDQAREAFYGRFEVVPRVRVTARGGRIELPFKDEDELRRLLERLS